MNIAVLTSSACATFRKVPRAVVCALALGLAACSPSVYNNVSTLGREISEINAMPHEEARAFIADKTIMTYDPGQTICYTVTSCQRRPGHGTQIEYFSDTGNAYLWYPGNAAAVPSKWRLVPRNDGKGYGVCFKYPSDSINKVTGERGGKVQCRHLGEYAANVVEVRSSDLFDLSSGAVPHRLKKNSTTFDTLLSNRQGS